MLFQSSRNVQDGFTASPASGNWGLSDLVWNSNPVPSGNLGWVCTTAGTASNTLWTASTPYTAGQIVYYGTQVYLCTTGGTSGTVAPTSTSTTVNDGSVVWAYVNPLAIFKTFGTIGA